MKNAMYEDDEENNTLPIKKFEQAATQESL